MHRVPEWKAGVQLLPAGAANPPHLATVLMFPTGVW
jgi:hypothetical protein